MKNYEITIYISVDDDISEEYIENTFERFLRQEEDLNSGGVDVKETK